MSWVRSSAAAESQRLTRWITVLVMFVSVDRAAWSRDGLWTSAAELRSVPMAGPGWDAVLASARKPTNAPNVADQEETTNTSVLAAGIVFARTGQEAYRDHVVAAIKTLVARGHPGGRTLAWARKTGSYALAADLVGYRSDLLDAWFDRMTDEYKCSQYDCTLREMFEFRPNNWGTHAFGTLVAVYAYRGKSQELQQVRDYFVRSVTAGDTGTRYRYKGPFGWHPERHRKFLINPSGATKDGLNIDGLMPDDLRRGGDFAIPPVYTNYVWEGQQGLIMAARILDRRGQPIWDVADRALYRAASALHVRFARQFGDQWKAQGDDQWMIRFVNEAYGTNLDIAPTDGWGHGKNAGFAYVLSASRP